MSERHMEATMSEQATATAVVERARTALMKRHHDEWEMETVSNAAHLVGEVVAQTGRPERDVLDEIDHAVSAFDHDSLRQRALDALRRALQEASRDCPA